MDGNGNIQARYAQGLKVDEPLAAQQAGLASYYEADGLGSITALTNSSGTIVATYRYDSFGVASSAADNNPFRYTARELDGETNLYYYRSRYFDPAGGRFVSEDPSSFLSGGVNFYSYVENSPLSFTDPNGLEPQSPSPCCAQQQQKIKNGLTQLQQALNGTKAAQSAVFKKYKTCLQNHLSNPDIKCGPPPKNQPTACGYHSPMSPGTVVLTPNGVSGAASCGPVKTTIAHELVHVCYQNDLTGPGLSPIDQEKEAFGIECQLWGINCACARDPKKCGY
jgi:RHS repeat-associated protein